MKQSSWSEWARSPFLAFTLLLLLKMAALRQFLFHEIRLVPLAADLAGVVLITGLIELVFGRRLKRYAYWGANAVLSIVLFAATLYFQHFGSVITYTALMQLKQLGQISSSVKATIAPADFVFFADMAVALAAKLWRLWRRRPAPRSGRGLPKWAALAVTAAGIGFTVVSVQTAQSATNELVEAENLGFVNYEASVIFNSLQDDSASRFPTLAAAAHAVERLESKYPYSHQSSGAAPAYFAAAQGKNVIVVQMEAFQNFPLHLSLNGQELTPVLNELADESFYFPHIYQQIEQGNTSDAEFMSNTSIYPTGTIPMSTGYGNRDLPSLPKLLENRNYETATFHVNDVTFWDRDKLYPALGFDHYYDKPYYENDHFNAFGASDENLYKEGMSVLSGLKQQGKPFYAQFVTASSHHPFKIPADKQTLTLPPSLENKQLGDYLQAIHYTDYALGTLIQQMKANGLWDNTVLVVYGDHFGLQPEDNDPQEVSAALGITYHPYLSRFNIPLIIHVPGQSGHTIDQVGGQLDIMPTVANLLGIDLDAQHFVHFGHDLLNTDTNILGIRYYMPTGSFINNDILFIPGKGFDDGTAISLKTMQPIQDFSMYRKDYNYILRLMNLSDEYVKLLPKRAGG